MTGTRRWVSDQTATDHLDPTVVAERDRQLAKWGVQHHGPEWWLTILTEEVGEYSEAILDLRWGDNDVDEAYAHMRDELVQVAAVALAAIADLDGHAIDDADAPAGLELPVVPPDGRDPARWWEIPAVPTH
jgi:NTP pyrophosphatase (non-canonical NTP hydrolase)